MVDMLVAWSATVWTRPPITTVDSGDSQGISGGLKSSWNSDPLLAAFVVVAPATSVRKQGGSEISTES